MTVCRALWFEPAVETVANSRIWTTFSMICSTAKVANSHSARRYYVKWNSCVQALCSVLLFMPRITGHIKVASVIIRSAPSTAAPTKEDSSLCVWSVWQVKYFPILLCHGEARVHVCFWGCWTRSALGGHCFGFFLEGAVWSVLT